MSDEVTLSETEARQLAMQACLNIGASQPSAQSLVDATLSAMRYGPPTLGFPHMVDYLESFRASRIKCDPTPVLDHAFPAFLTSDADQGIAQLGFDRAFGKLLEATRTFGVAIFTQTNSYTVGELGYYVRRLAREGLIGLAATNANAMVAPKAGGPAVYSTNPLAFGFPLGDGALPLVIDQASSATAYVNVVRAAAEGQSIPEGWAVDSNGDPTSDPVRAIGGALLPFGGRKGGNVALLVEMLSAGLSGGPWSLDTPDFTSGSVSPAVGLTVVAIMPNDGRIERAAKQAARLAGLGVFVPGVTGIGPSGNALKIPRDVFDAVQRFAAL
ncbi:MULTISPECIES: Ldh family oxidoreductase [unclassified Brucella]|uniref:Ldh family oxidoreductase n=1 Tax=unclassified Brucella TaxID=2632610 RepID=UPI0002DBEBC5|nr:MULTISPECIES: Ldh family oxidoreductase [unclassified Brucella]QGA57917.1 malate dehydrogenase [Brucella sp. 2280]QPN27647.1 Ldh family oxidoreductase [Brucella sp. BO2]